MYMACTVERLRQAARNAPVVLLLGRLKNSVWVGQFPPCSSRFLERLPPSARAQAVLSPVHEKWPGRSGRFGRFRRPLSLVPVRVPLRCLRLLVFFVFVFCRSLSVRASAASSSFVCAQLCWRSPGDWVGKLRVQAFIFQPS